MRAKVRPEFQQIALPDQFLDAGALPTRMTATASQLRPSRPNSKAGWREAQVEVRSRGHKFPPTWPVRNPEVKRSASRAPPYNPLRVSRRRHETESIPLTKSFRFVRCPNHENTLTPAPQNLNDYDVGAMGRHPSVLPSSRAHQNMGTRYGSDCDQEQRRPGWAYLSPM